MDVTAPALRRPENSRAERAAAGKAARAAVPLRAHAELELAPDRDVVGLLLGQATSRVPELVPVRHGRMLASPFTFFRGAALPMAADLASSPDSGLRVQLCGDAHLANFGAFASPERRLVFDLNDFDETLPGPFEWDVKRLGASFEVAGRDNGFSDKQRRAIVLAAARGYREAMRDFAQMPTLDVWYAGTDLEEALQQARSKLKKGRYEASEALLTKARKRDSTQALGKLTTVVDGRRRIVSDPPLVVPVEELFDHLAADAINQEIRSLVDSYGRSLQPNRRHLLHQFTVTQLARKVVGVGSVGTRAWILLLEADGGEEHLFLQAKEAQESVLAAYAGRSRFANHGQRVVVGQQLMQAVSDIFLGWQRTTGVDGVERAYYVRQLRDWKFSAPIDQMVPSGMQVYADLCARTLARAHARSGDRIAIAAYLGSSEKFDNAIADFAVAYADLTERDHAALAAAVDEGRAAARFDV
ncbi:DUF2252 domain-containing protein [Nocardioides guangzhouensis]|uniref:DUF2252 domain-containing protein n=1 Tax=Nocardioides guangzhouensis TaxID=2497878 RepID=A0A4Q4ZIK4_9ACTN|nr:DUF2252 domain-containing protein [Nocardioides guangzhouensis]RYP88070.1 DUF2252 domain-containing protein [Nocardioides guangzhouensis]